VTQYAEKPELLRMLWLRHRNPCPRRVLVSSPSTGSRSLCARSPRSPALGGGAQLPSLWMKIKLHMDTCLQPLCIMHSGGAGARLPSFLWLTRTIYKRCTYVFFLQGNYQIYGHIQCIYTNLANPGHFLKIVDCAGTHMLTASYCTIFRTS
jgi:hypothetical protein